MTEISSDGWSRRGFVATSAAAIGAASLGIAPTASARTTGTATRSADDRLPAFPGAEARASGPSVAGADPCTR